MLENDDTNEIPPHENLLNGEKRVNKGINKETYEIINDKKKDLQNLKVERDKVISCFEENNQHLMTKQNMIASLIIKKQNIAHLKDELKHFNSRNKQSDESCEHSKKRITKKREAIHLMREKIEKCKQMVRASENATHNKTNNDKDGLNTLKLRLVEYEKQRIAQLNQFVFDLIEIKQKDAAREDVLEKSTRTALKDARQTVYVNGRWILANDHVVVYTILRSILPTDGDYLTYFKDFQQKEGKLKDDESHQLDDIDRQFQNQSSQSNTTTTTTTTNRSSSSSLLNNTLLWTSSSTTTTTTTPSNQLMDKQTILSGLTYTVQFVNLIAFYLGIVLPYNLPHNKFCTQALKENQFQNAVAKLNTNIVYLSINQHIPVTNLLPKHTLENLHHFLTYFRELRIKIREKHSISFPSHMIPLLEEMFTESEEEFFQDCMPNLVFNDNEEWETVPNSNEIPSDDSFTASGSGSGSGSGSMSRTVSSSLISSVSSSVISWFKPQTK
jgi:hypothetical protein